MMRNFKSMFLTMIVLLSLFLVTACPSPPAIEKAKTASAKLAGYANSGVEVTRSLFRENVITLEQKDEIADGFIELAKAGIAFDAAVRELENQYTDGHPPRDKLSQLAALFNAGIVEKFLAVLVSLKVIGAGGKFQSALELLKTTILIVASAFDLKSATRARIAEAAGV